MRKKILVFVLTMVLLTSFSVQAFACTPKLNTSFVQIPKITVKFDEKTEKAIGEAAEKFIEKDALEKTTIQSASYFCKTLRYGTYSCLSARWNEVENATSYDVKIAKSDGTEKVFSTSCSSFIASSYFDDFLSSGMDGAVIKVKAYGENETFGLWSDEMSVSKFDF